MDEKKRRATVLWLLCQKNMKMVQVTTGPCFESIDGRITEIHRVLHPFRILFAFCSTCLDFCNDANTFKIYIFFGAERPRTIT